MAIQKQPLAENAINLVSALSLVNGTSYTVQNTGTETLWFGSYENEPTADAMRADALFLKEGDYGGIKPAAGSPVYAVAKLGAVTQISVNEG